MHLTNKINSGFTLIELSIVLVIIGLIVGGILTGRDLIDTAMQRVQVTQINKYQTAVHAFQLKYGYLPGDISDPTASQFGFLPRGQYDGEGDGNGLLRGNCDNTASSGDNHNLFVGCGEPAVFWVDLSTAGLIDTTISSGSAQLPRINNAPSIFITLATSPAVKDWLPTAKMGTNNYIYVYSLKGTNYFGLSAVTQLQWKIYSAAQPGITVQQAYDIDSKIDDGLPQSGQVNACFLSEGVQSQTYIWAAGGGLQGANSGSGDNNCISTTAATPPASTDCYGNNNTAGTMTYSVSANANAQNCALSFRFQ